MRIARRLTLTTAAAAASIALVAAPAQASTLVATFANSIAGGMFCHAVEGALEQQRADEEGTPGDRYVCVQTPTQWELYRR